MELPIDILQREVELHFRADIFHVTLLFTFYIYSIYILRQLHYMLYQCTFYVRFTFYDVTHANILPPGPKEIVVAS